VNARYSATVDRDAAEEIDTIDESEWDDVADVICVGNGRWGTVLADAARRADLDVVVANGPVTRSGAGHLDTRLGIADEDTVAYIRALTEDFGPLAESDPSVADMTVVTRAVDAPLPAFPKDRIPTFFGAALRDWGSDCMASPYGVLYTRVVDPALKINHASADGPVAVTVLDTIDIDPDRLADSVARWLSTHDEGGDSDRQSFQRLVFDERGMVAGAVLESDGELQTVGVRHGVLLPLQGLMAANDGAAQLDLSETAEVALVWRMPSRFARLELVTLTQR